MANRSNEAAGAAALNGLVGGFLQGHDLRRQRTGDQEARAEAERQRQRQEQADAFAIEDRGYAADARGIAAEDRALALEDRTDARAISDYDFTQQTGFARGEDSTGRYVAQLRGSVGDMLTGQTPAPEGYHRVGLGQDERAQIEEQEFNTRAAAFISATPEEQRRFSADPAMAAVIKELGVYDNLFDRGQGGGESGPAPITVTVDGLKQDVGSVEEAIALRDQFAQEEAPDLFARSSELRSEFDGHPVIKASLDVVQSFKRFDSIAQREPTAAGDIALVFSFMKMNDPDSTVREGEFATAANAGGVPERARATYNNMLNGQLLDDTVRQDFIGTAMGLVKGQADAVGPVLSRYSDLAERAGVNVDNVVFDPLTGIDLSGYSDDNPFAPGR